MFHFPADYILRTEFKMSVWNYCNWKLISAIGNRQLTSLNVYRYSISRQGAPHQIWKPRNVSHTPNQCSLFCRHVAVVPVLCSSGRIFFGATPGALQLGVATKDLQCAPFKRGTRRVFCSFHFLLGAFLFSTILFPGSYLQGHKTKL